MGFFSGITKAIGGITKSIGDVFNPISGLAGLASGILGGMNANSANKAMAREQMDFQERMRATQYQTAVADLQAAGLNPMLAYSQGGAGNLPGASARFENVGASGAAASSATSSAAVNRTMIEKIQADTAVSASQAKLNMELADKARIEATTSSSQYNVNMETVREIRARIDQLAANTDLSYQQKAKIEKEIEVLLKDLEYYDGSKIAEIVRSVIGSAVSARGFK